MLQTYPAVSLGLVICLAMLIVILFENKVKKLLFQGMIGILLISGINVVVPEQYEVTLDMITTAIVAMLGIPGVILLYLIKVFIN